MDIVDDVIRHLGLRSRVAYRLEQTGGWDAITRDSQLLQLHCVLDGTCWYRLSTGPTERRLQRGDVLLLPRGGRMSLLPTPSDTHPPPPGNGDHVEPDVRASILAARVLTLGVEVELAGHPRHPLFDGLPEAMQIDRASFLASGTREHAGYLIEKTGGRETEAESAIIDRLVEILLIQAIKAHHASTADDDSFLRVLADPAISQAVAAIHRSPGFNWSLERLAAASGLSRSVFSRRFTDLTGVPAMHYLTAWRMQLALEKLRSGCIDAQSVAHSVGYLSIVAFQKAFKRVHGFTPAQVSSGHP